MRRATEFATRRKVALQQPTAASARATGQKGAMKKILRAHFDYAIQSAALRASTFVTAVGLVSWRAMHFYQHYYRLVTGRTAHEVL